MSHPDKVCDQISDAILDACLAQDPMTRAGIETVGGHGVIAITGELTTKAYVDMRGIAKKIYEDCGYGSDIGVMVNVVEQSPEIKEGVDHEGAGDQGIMVGYATAETPEMLPLEVILSRKLTKSMGRHDGKSQVTLNGGKIERVLTSLCTSGDMSDVKLDEVAEKELSP